MSYSYNVDCPYLNKKRLNILIVDDDITASSLFKEILELRGHTVCTLNEGVKCLSNCMKNKYDIIFLDFHIGDIDGAEVADCLKDVLHAKSHIYVYTGDSDPQILNKCREIGMNGAIIKPLNIDNINNIMLNIESETKNDNNNEKKKFNQYTKCSSHCYNKQIFNVWY